MLEIRMLARWPKTDDQRVGSNDRRDDQASLDDAGHIRNRANVLLYLANSVFAFWAVAEESLVVQAGFAFEGASVLTFPFTIGIGILRYRLYDIDLDGISGRLLQISDETVLPEHVSLWLKRVER